MPEKSGESFNPIKIDKKALETRGLLPNVAETKVPIRGGRGDEDAEGGIERMRSRGRLGNQNAEGVQDKKKTRRERKSRGADDSVLTPPEPASIAPSEALSGESDKTESAPKASIEKGRLADVLTDGDKKHLERIYKDMSPEEAQRFQKSLEELDTRRIRVQIKDRLKEALGTEPASLSNEELAERIRKSGVKDIETVARRLYGIKNPDIEEFRKEVLNELGMEYNKGLFGGGRRKEGAGNEVLQKHLPEDTVRAEEGIKFAYQEYFENVLKNFHDKGELSVDPEIYQKMGAIDAEAVKMFGSKRLQEMREELAKERGFHYDTLREMLVKQKKKDHRNQEKNEYGNIPSSVFNDLDYQLKEQERIRQTINDMKNQESRSAEVSVDDELEIELRKQAAEALEAEEKTSVPAVSSESAPFKKAKRETKKAREARIAAAADSDIEEAYDSIRDEKKKNDLDGLGFSAMGANIEEADLKAAQAERERDLKNFEAGPGKLAEQEYSERFNKRLAEEALGDEPLYEKVAAGKETAAPAEGTPEYAEVKGRLDSAKENYQRILNDKNSDPLAKKDALRRYLEVRNEFVKGDVPRFVSEMLDGLKEKTKRKEGLWEHALGFSKKLGEMNLSKTNWEWVKKLEQWGKVPEKKLKLWGNKTFTVGGWSLGAKIAKGVNARTAIAGGLLGLAWPAALVAGATGAAGALGLSAAFRGAGAMMGSYEAMRQGQQMLTNVSERDVAINFNDQEVVDAKNSDLSVSRMSAAEVEEKLLGLIARARMNASWDQYKKPIELLAKRYQENLQSAVAAGYDLEEAGTADIKTLLEENADPKKVNKTYEERREEVFGEKKKRAFKEEAAMRAGAGAVGLAAAGSAVGFGRIGNFLKGLFGIDSVKAEDMLAHEWRGSELRHASGEAIAAQDMLDHERGATMQRLRSPKASDFSRAFSGEEISAKPWQSYQEFTNEPTPYREFDEEYYDPKLLGEDVEDEGLTESIEDKSDTSEQKKPDSVEPEKPPITKRQLIGYSGLRPEYYELVKEMSVEEYLEKKGMKFAFNQKDVFPIPNIDGEYPWQRQDRLAHNRWMDYDRLQERMRIAVGGMTDDARENAMRGMTVEEFIKQYFAE